VKVALINMPFSPADRASVQIAILRALLNEESIDADEVYANLDFFGALREEDAHRWYSSSLPALVGEWLFSREPAPSDEDLAAAADDVRDPLHRLPGFAASWGQTMDELLAFRTGFIRDFMAKLIASRDWSQYDALAFTLTYPQINASFWLADELKQRHPHLKTIFGGALSQMHPDSGPAYMRAYDFIDHFVIGEAETVFGPLCARLRDGADVGRDLDGVYSRSGDEVVEPENAVAVCEDFNAAPFPDYRGFAAAREALPEETLALVDPDIPVEMARGCVWAVKKVCSFCGFYPDGGYRRKSDDHAIEELVHQVKTLGWSRFYSLDAYIPHGLLNGVFRRIPREAPNITFPFIELRTKMKRAEVELLVDAGVTLVQPGVECMEEGLLEKILKGVTLVDNLNFLKWCRELDLDCSWNLLLGLPDATLEELERQAEVLAKIPHLAPPAPTKLIFVRASTYHQRPDDYGLTNVRPDPFYARIHPERMELDQVAYEFEADWDRERQMPLLEKTTAIIADWRNRWAAGDRPVLEANPVTGGVVVTDTRDASAPRQVALSNAAGQVLPLIADRALSVDALVHQSGRTRDEIDEALARLDREGFAIETRTKQGRQWISLATLTRKLTLGQKLKATRRKWRGVAEGGKLNVLS
jgi:ribosomal peptide maturation radical SAM protein 1